MRKAAFHFCEDRNVSARVHEICLLTTTLLDVFFDVLLTDGGSKCLIDIIRTLNFCVYLIFFFSCSSSFFFFLFFFFFFFKKMFENDLCASIFNTL